MPLPLLVQKSCDDAAELLSQADGLLITAGAGIGIDSGLPDFRGDNGFWKTYPALGEIGMHFTQIANPRVFKTAPRLAWGFYGHRLQLYRATEPHAGFGLLQKMAATMPRGAFVYTSNVDGQFQKAGFPGERVTECHGSIHYLQCMDKCGEPIWPADEFNPEIDSGKCMLVSDLPTCPGCGALARPNILMFGDWGWDDDRAKMQEARLQAWLARSHKLVVMEIGAGSAIATVRYFGERCDVPLIRINPSESTVGLHRDIGIPIGGLEGIGAIAKAMGIT